MAAWSRRRVSSAAGIDRIEIDGEQPAPATRVVLM